MSCLEIAVEPSMAVQARRDGPWPLTRRPTDPDAALVAGLRRGEESAAETLVEAYGDRAYRLALRVTGNAAAAAEVLQDAVVGGSEDRDSRRFDVAEITETVGLTVTNTKTRIHRARIHLRQRLAESLGWGRRPITPTKVG